MSLNKRSNKYENVGYIYNNTIYFFLILLYIIKNIIFYMKNSVIYLYDKYLYKNYNSQCVGIVSGMYNIRSIKSLFRYRLLN